MSHRFIRETSTDYIVLLSTSIPNATTGLYEQHNGFGYTYQLNDVINPTDFTTLFDQYRIRGVATIITPTFQVGNMGPPTAGNLVYEGCDVQWMIDLDDATTPTTVTEMSERAAHRKRLVGDKPLSMFLRPRALTNIYNGTLPADAHGLSRRSEWIDMSNSQVPHYGLKVFITCWANHQPIPPEPPMSFKVVHRYYIECRTAR